MIWLCAYSLRRHDASQLWASGDWCHSIVWAVSGCWMEGCARTFCCMAEVQCMQCACGQRQEQLSGLYRACAGAVARWLAAANGLKQGHTHIAPHGVPEGLAVALGLGNSHSLTCAPCSTQRTRCLVHLHVLQAQPCSWRHVSWARALQWKARSASTGNDCLHVLAAVQQMVAAKADLQSTSRTWEWVALAYQFFTAACAAPASTLTGG